jgi:hypothetical protein
MKKALIPIALFFLLSPLALADDTLAEIEYLLDAIGSSECIFIRNGKQYDAEKAEAHLRMKYKRGQQYVTSSETFITRLASKSSMTGKPYLMECSGADREPVDTWLMQRLKTLRSDQVSMK